MAQREEGECIGGGGLPVRQTEQLEIGGSWTGQCPACFERLKLDENGLIPKHQLPERFR